MKSYEPEKSRPRLDEAAMLNGLGGDREFLSELIGLFLAASPTLLARIRAALAIKDRAEARRAARILRSALRSFAAERALNAAEVLEAALYQCPPEAATEAFFELEKQIACLSPALSRLERSRGHSDPVHRPDPWRHS